MVNVDALFNVKSGGVVREERKQMEVDNSTFDAATSDKGREKLGDWAKTLFPKADWARVITMKRR